MKIWENITFITNYIVLKYYVILIITTEVMPNSIFPVYTYDNRRHYFLNNILKKGWLLDKMAENEVYLFFTW